MFRYVPGDSRSGPRRCTSTRRSGCANGSGRTSTALHEGEDRDVGADAQGEHQNGGCGESRLLPQRSERRKPRSWRRAAMVVLFRGVRGRGSRGPNVTRVRMLSTCRQYHHAARPASALVAALPKALFQIAGNDFGIVGRENGVQSDVPSAEVWTGRIYPFAVFRRAAEPAGHQPERLVYLRDGAFARGLDGVEPLAFSAAGRRRVAETRRRPVRVSRGGRAPCRARRPRPLVLSSASISARIVTP